YLSRMIFSFRYTAMFRRFGAFWCGISLTAIVYVAVFKGLKSVLHGNPVIEFVNDYTLASLAVCWVACSLVLFFLQRLKINILRITILSGSFALALSFAGNDLVNFIGVPVAGFDAYNVAQATGNPSMPMDALNDNVPANFYLLLTAGAIMIVALWTSRKAMAVLTEREMSLTSAQEDSGVQSDSSAFSRTLVRAALNINTAIEAVVPEKIRNRVSKRFEYADVEHSGAPYDMIRAAVNLTTSAMLISMATSFKLPLSTTYVCFMVAMGSSLADRAWGRESAVYRITGVITVVMGWFVTALGGFLIAYVVGLILIYGGTAAIVVTSVVCGYMLYRNLSGKKKTDKHDTAKAGTEEDIMANITDEVCTTMELTTRLYDRTLIAVFKENRKVLREMVKEAEELFQHSRARKYAPLSYTHLRAQET
ncbi:MAG: inorganic phosphate transporter, partial [Alistipes sp.]|nr:inorganic phosphate transporter [Alistipes sp.]